MKMILEGAVIAMSGLYLFIIYGEIRLPRFDFHVICFYEIARQFDFEHLKEKRKELGSLGEAISQ